MEIHRLSLTAMEELLEDTELNAAEEVDGGSDDDDDTGGPE